MKYVLLAIYRCQGQFGLSQVLLAQALCSDDSFAPLRLFWNWCYIGIMEKKMETTIMGYNRDYIGYILG